VSRKFVRDPDPPSSKREDKGGRGGDVNKKEPDGSGVGNSKVIPRGTSELSVQGNPSKTTEE
jgi:hypothetical protein